SDAIRGEASTRESAHYCAVLQQDVLGFGARREDLIMRESKHHRVHKTVGERDETTVLVRIVHARDETESSWPGHSRLVGLYLQEECDRFVGHAADGPFETFPTLVVMDELAS